MFSDLEEVETVPGERTDARVDDEKSSGRQGGEAGVVHNDGTQLRYVLANTGEELHQERKGGFPADRITAFRTIVRPRRRGPEFRQGNFFCALVGAIHPAFVKPKLLFEFPRNARPHLAVIPRTAVEDTVPYLRESRVRTLAADGDVDGRHRAVPKDRRSGRKQKNRRAQ